MADIELDLYAPVETGPVRVPPPRGYRWIAVPAVLILLLTLGGAARPSPALLVPGGQLALGADAQFGVIGDQLFTYQVKGVDGTVTAWSIGPLRRLWRTTFRLEPAEGGSPGYLETAGHLFVATPDGVLLTSFFTTVSMDVQTGSIRWRANRLVIPLPGGRAGVSYDLTFPAGSELADGNSDSVVYYGNGGLFTEPAVHTKVRVVDLRTGKFLWTVDRNGQATAMQTADDPGRIVVQARDRLTALAADTGRVLADRPLTGQPAGSSDDTTAQIAGDVVAVQQGAATARGTLTGYDRRTLKQRWQVPAADGNNPYGCSGLLCSAAGDRTVVRDPATGRQLWTADQQHNLIADGPDVVETALEGARPLHVRDRTTGADRADLSPWTWYATGEGGRPRLLGHEDTRGGTAFGVRRSGTGQIQPLGRSPVVVAECSADGHLLACRVQGGGLRTWTYRS